MERQSSVTSRIVLPKILNLFGAYGTAHLGDQIALIAIPLMMLHALHGDAANTSLLVLAGTLPALLLAIPLGVLGDGHDQRTVMIAGEAVRTLAIGLALGSLMAGWANFWLLAILSLLGATGTVAFTVVAPAKIAALVHGPERSIANGRMELVRSIATTFGPAFGGALCAWTGETQALWAALGCSTLSVMLLMRLPTSEGSIIRTPQHPLSAIREGLNVVLKIDILRTFVVVAIWFNVA